MKKIIAVIPITILFILLSTNINVHAATYRGIFVKYTIDPSDDLFDFYFTTESDPIFYYSEVVNDQYGRYMITCNRSLSVGYFSGSAHHTLSDWLDKIATGSGIASNGGPYLEKCLPPIIAYNATIYPASGQDSSNDDIFDNVQDYEDYINPPPPDPTWYDEMYESFLGVVESIATIATGGLSELVEAFTDFWVVPVGGDEGDMFFPTDIVMASPTPTPTPIQYQTVIAPTTDPQGHVVYEYKYVYNNPYGTPIITSSPPVNNITYNGDSFDYPYYDNPDNRNNPYKLKIPWYLKLIFGDKIVDETTLDDSVNVIQDYMNDDDINDGVTTVYEGMSAIPTNWLILIGVIASIPLFGCLISRLLS